MNGYRQLRWAALAIGVVLAAGYSADQARAAEPTEVKVLSFNIRYGSANDGENNWVHRRDMVIDVFKEHGGDFTGVQEAELFQIEELAEALPEYHHIGRSREVDPKVGEATPIFYRHDRWSVDPDESGTFWLSDTPDEPGSKSWGNDLPRITTWARFVEKGSGSGADRGRGVYVYNTHFDHRSQESRVKSAALLAKHIVQREHDDPVIVTGDFNADEDNPVIEYLKGRDDQSPVDLLDTFRVVHEDATEVGTTSRWVGRKNGAKIDYVFTTPGVEVTDAQIIYDNEDGRYPSDHYPVSAELVLPAE